MRWALLGFVLGILIGLYTPINIPIEYSRYTAVAVLGIIDSIVGAIRADMRREYHSSIFVSGLIINMVIAVIITYIGDRLSLDLYLAIVIAFTVRMMQNIATIRYAFLERFIGKKQVLEKIHSEPQ